MCSSTRGPAIAPSLVTCPTKIDDDAALLGEPRQLRRAFAHLRHAAGRRLQRLRVDGLDRVDDDDLGLRRVDRRDDRLELHLGQQLDRRVDEAQPLRAQRDLLDRFLAGHVQRAMRGAERRADACSSSVDLPMPGSPPSSTTPPGDEAAAQHAIELLEPGGDRARSPAPSTRASGVTDRASAGDGLEAHGARVWRRSRRACSTRRSCGHWPCHLGAVPPHSVQRVDGLCLGHRLRACACTSRERARVGEVVLRDDARTPSPARTRRRTRTTCGRRRSPTQPPDAMCRVDAHEPRRQQRRERRIGEDRRAPRTGATRPRRHGAPAARSARASTQPSSPRSKSMPPRLPPAGRAARDVANADATTSRRASRTRRRIARRRRRRRSGRRRRRTRQTPPGCRRPSRRSRGRSALSTSDARRDGRMPPVEARVDAARSGRRAGT